MSRGGLTRAHDPRELVESRSVLSRTTRNSAHEARYGRVAYYPYEDRVHPQNAGWRTCTW
eukprot:scaffold56081_cov27-Tisochrysis_lutea.AAC.4